MLSRISIAFLEAWSRRQLTQLGEKILQQLTVAPLALLSLFQEVVQCTCTYKDIYSCGM
jgi:hypothetical protein